MGSLLRSLNVLRKELLRSRHRSRTTASNRGPLVYATPQVPASNPARSSGQAAYGGRVVKVVRATASATSFELERTDGRPFDFKPGMFVTTIVRIDGQEFRRAYSICSRADESQTITITVKRVPDGRVSNHLVDSLKSGDVIQLLGPSGHFFVEPDDSTARSLLLVGGGSGITPLMSILRTLLPRETGPHITLLYGNHGSRDIIFAHELAALAAQYPERLALMHVLEKPARSWKGAVGRLDQAQISQCLDGRYGSTLPPGLEAWLCGPTPVIDAARAELSRRGVPAQRIHQESFTSAAPPSVARRYTEQSVSLTIGDRCWTMIATPGQSILDAALAAQVPLPFSCTLGGCGHCRVRVLDGNVDMPEPNCLLPDETKEGYALACIARPLTAVSLVAAPAAAP